jgi:hypothetical protein
MLKILIFSIVLSFAMPLVGQSSIKYDLINEECYLAIINYNGRFKSVAERDTVWVPSFEMLSIGKLVNTEVKSSGYVRVLLEYKSGEMVILQSQRTYEQNPRSRSSWQTIEYDGFGIFNDFPLRKNRNSIAMRLDNGVWIGLVNVKDKNVDLYKYIVSTLSF